MNKLIFALFFAVAMAGNVFAQGTSVTPNNKNASWEQSVDMSTEWGKWLMNAIKPYLDKMGKAVESSGNALVSAMGSDPYLPQDEVAKKVKENQVALLNTFQNIIPPPELKTYHSRIVELYSETSQLGPGQATQLAAVSKKLMGEARQELMRVLAEHGVPQRIIDELVKNP